MFGRRRRQLERDLSDQLWESARLHERLAAQERRAGDLQTERDYWRSRCELLIDAGLARRGEVHEPVMHLTKAPADPMAAVGTIFSGLGRTELTPRTTASQPGQTVSERGGDPNQR
jgi:hypothetical protein